MEAGFLVPLSLTVVLREVVDAFRGVIVSGRLLLSSIVLDLFLEGKESFLEW